MSVSLFNKDATAPTEEKPTQDELLDDHFSFKTTSFVRHDTLLSIIYFCVLIGLPPFVWPEANDTLLHGWQIVMLGLTASRWIVRAFFNVVQSNKLAGHVSSGVMFLALLDGLGWGIAGVLFMPSTPAGIYLTALLLLGMAGIGAAAYSSRMLIAVPYLFCVTTPFVFRLVQLPEENFVLLAILVVLLSLVFCFVADKLNITLQDALSKHADQHDQHDILRADMRQLKSQLMEMDSQRLRAKSQLKDQRKELSLLQDVLLSYDDELDKLESLSINLRDELYLLDESQPQEQLRLNLDRLRLSADALVDKFQSEEPVALVDADQTKPYAALPAPDHKGGSADNVQEAGTQGKQSRADGNKRVLIINTDPQETRKIEGLCREGNFTYHSIETVPEALKILCEESANALSTDLIICQRELADMDGPGFANCLLEDTEYQTIPFVFITHGTSQSHPSETNLHNVVAEVHRPLDLNELEAAIVHALNTDVVILPEDLAATVSDSEQIAANNQLHENHKDIDPFVLEGLRVTANHRFEEIVSAFLEQAPELIQQAQTACRSGNLGALIENIEELKQRCLHMGALNLMDRCTEFSDQLSAKTTPERLMGLLHFIEADFIDAESTLLAALTQESSLDSTFIHSPGLRRDL